MKKNEELRILNATLERRVEERTNRLREENEQRRFAQEQAELANETKNRFLATISHEIRTPINAIIGFCDLAIKTDVDNDHQRNLKRVKDSSEHLLAMIKDILDYSQIESGRMELKESSFDHHKLITSVINAYYLDASSKDIRLACAIDEQIPKYLIGDPDALRQVLYNLIGNAIKFTDKGTVDVQVKLSGEASSDDKIRLMFSVKDSGIGISKLKQKLIFMDFTQADNSETRRYGGVGLGLTISKYFVELMGGKITVHSDKGAGSEFKFDIFLKVDTEKTESRIKKQPAVNKKLHLLIAEDNILNSQVISVFLNRLGHTSKVASNGKVAVEFLSQEDFDAVLMDIEMPEMDGIEATQVIRSGIEHVRNPKIPIIALTAHALKAYEEKCYEAGMNSYLTKPVDIEKLSSVLQTV
jgi:signal transduction histidine kinase/CheY-like chemotaxis protein